MSLNDPSIHLQNMHACALKINLAIANRPASLMLSSWVEFWVAIANCLWNKYQGGSVKQCATVMLMLTYIWEA